MLFRMKISVFSVFCCGERFYKQYDPILREAVTGTMASNSFDLFSDVQNHPKNNRRRYTRRAGTNVES